MVASHILITFLLLFGMSPIVNAEEEIDKLKTLFTTQIERTELSNMRDRGEFDNEKNKTSGVPVKLEPTKVELRGVIIREKGKPIVWVNNRNTLKSDVIDSEIAVKTKNINKKELKIPLRVNQKILTMKPGQTWNESENKIKDKYQTK